MIEEFIASWPLFSDTYLVGWLAATALAIAGVQVVARDQIFLGAAVSQASTLGTAIALRLQGVVAFQLAHDEALVTFFAVAASIATALLTSRPARAGAESAEAVTGWVFLLGASVPVLMMAHSPHGLEEIHRLLVSSILGASRADVWVFGGLLIATVAGVAVNRDRLVLFAMDPEMAAACGVGTRRWRVGTAIWLGTSVGLAIHAAGMLYTFGCLVLPALTARSLCREVRPMFIVAPAIGLGSSVVAFVLANGWDVPPAQLTVALQCSLFAAAAAWRAARS